MRGDKRFEGIDIAFENAHVTFGEAGGRAAALREFLVTGSGTRFDKEIAYAQLFDKAQRFGTCAGADGQHGDDCADAEDNAEGGENAAGFLR